MKKYFKSFLVIIILILFIFIFAIFYYFNDDSNLDQSNYVNFYNFIGMNIDEAVSTAGDYGIYLDVSYKYDFQVQKDIIISQGELVGDNIKVVVSMGEVPFEIYENNKVNELGNVPIMMYHGIVNIGNDDTKYIGGNVDKDGYNRTSEAFRSDLEFYYSNGYRMIRLNDYVNGIIDVELGKSPIILTFDDGNENNFKVLGEENGELIIDPNCAVGILEEFKKKYPDYGVTATFFVNSGKFNQDGYNDKILKWLVSHGYDVGNHTMTHCDFKKVDADATRREVGGLYQVLDEVIPGKYVNIVALPFGSPYSRSHSNYEVILNGEYNGLEYKTIATLRVGWEAENSPFDINFDPTYLKRIRAYDNNGVEFDIEMNFKFLNNNRYISDGDVETIVIREENKNNINDKGKNLRLITY